MTNNTDATTPGGSSSAGNRPKPQFGEYAPPGWSHQAPETTELVPAEQETAPAGTATPADSAPRASSPLSSASHVNAGQAQFGTAPRQRSSFDLGVSLTLLVLSFFGATMMVGAADQLSQVFQQMHDLYSLPEYVEPANLGSIMVFGKVSQIILWLAMVSLTVVLLVRRRRAFYVPLIGAVISFVLLITMLTMTLNADPTLVNHIS